jgi:hypothetical protein
LLRRNRTRSGHRHLTGCSIIRLGKISRIVNAANTKILLVIYWCNKVFWVLAVLLKWLGGNRFRSIIDCIVSSQYLRRN